jgi:hypothetical protein
VNREDIIRMVGEAARSEGSQLFGCGIDDLERFAALVAAHEREACAAIAEMPKYLNETGILTVNPAKSAAAHFIAIAIRARGEVPR